MGVHVSLDLVLVHAAMSGQGYRMESERWSK